MVDESMSDEEWRELTEKWDRSIADLIASRRFAEAIDRLRSWLSEETGISARCHLLHDLSMLLFVDGQKDESLSALQECIELEPDQPINWCALAKWHMTCGKTYPADHAGLSAALEAIETAVAKARVSGEWLRYCLNDRCRIVVAMKRYDLLEETLREILAMRPRPGVPDIGIEDDFLRHRVPEGAIDSDLLARYRAAIAEQEARRAKRRSKTDKPTE